MLRIPVDEWSKFRAAVTWTRERQAPEAWARMDLGWYLTCGALPSVREAAAWWGWSKSRAAQFIRRDVPRALELQAEANRLQAEANRLQAEDDRRWGEP